MLNAAQSDSEAKPVDLKPILSKCGKVTVLSEPTVMTLVGQTAEFRSGGERFLPAADRSGESPRFFGIAASITPKLRPSGKMEFVYEIQNSSIVNDDAGEPAQFDETVIESSAILETGEWHVVDMNQPTQANVRHGRVRILALRPYWMMRHR
ncbi:MAG TPA: hypothetical protein VGN57_00105 [Pirellulaceae bacterium]|jgi:hypothetical protein|nr:hypothetical protein [Pirellulaceae bacterium]